MDHREWTKILKKEKKRNVSTSVTNINSALTQYWNSPPTEIPIVDQYKYPGLIFDHKLSFIYFIKKQFIENKM